MAKNVVEILQELVAIPSVNPDGNPGISTTGEQACAEAVGAILAGCGAAVEFQPVLPGRPNVIGRFPTSRPGKPRILLAPHLDTVSVVGMTIDPFGAEIREGRLYGRGATDTKGTMASMLGALVELKDRIADLNVEIWFVGLMGEEAGQHGAKAFAGMYRDQYGPEIDRTFALVGEPTGCKVVYTHKGCVWLTLKASGVAVHASTPGRGENAIYKMTDAISILRRELLPDFEALNDPVLGAPSMSVGTIQGGSKTNIVPDACEASVDLRIIPVQDPEQLVEKIRTRLAALVEVKARKSQPLFTDPNHPMIQTLVTCGTGLTGAPWFCDAAVLADAGMAAVAAGPGDIAQAHTRDEWISLADLESGVGFYRNFLLNAGLIVS